MESLIEKKIIEILNQDETFENLKKLEKIFIENEIDLNTGLNRDFFYAMNNRLNDFGEDKFYLTIMKNLDNINKKHIYESLIIESISSGNLSLFKKNIVKIDLIENSNFYKNLIFSCIKYGNYEVFEYLISSKNEKEKIKIINNANKEFWNYFPMFTNAEFLVKLVNHELNTNLTIKQGVYSIIDSERSDFLNKFFNNKKCIQVSQEINKNHYYKILNKKINTVEESEKKENLILLFKKSTSFYLYDFKDFNLKEVKNEKVLKIINNILLKNDLDENLSYKENAKKPKI